MSHTKEPWALRASQVPGSDYVHVHATVRERIAVVVGEDDARRIVACVNACEGHSTEDLETHPGPIITKLLNDRDKVEQQRDELLAAAKNLRDVKGRHHSEQAFKTLVEAITKVEAAHA